MSDKARTEEVDDQFRALMEGLRTTLPGVQVLFAFLLILPFQAPFDELRDVDRIVYYVAFTASAVASVLLIAPSAHQRLRVPFTGIPRRSYSDVVFGAKLAIAGTVVFAIAMSAAVYLVSTFLFADVQAAIATVVVIAVIAWSWFYVPLVYFQRR